MEVSTGGDQVIILLSTHTVELTWDWLKTMMDHAIGSN